MFKIILTLDSNFQVIETKTKQISSKNIPEQSQKVHLSPKQMQILSKFTDQQYEKNNPKDFIEKYSTAAPNHLIWENLISKKIKESK